MINLTACKYSIILIILFLIIFIGYAIYINYKANTLSGEILSNMPTVEKFENDINKKEML